MYTVHCAVQRTVPVTGLEGSLMAVQALHPLYPQSEQGHSFIELI